LVFLNHAYCSVVTRSKMKDFELTRLQRIVLTVVLSVVIILLLILVSYRTQVFPAGMLGTPTHVNTGISESGKRIVRVGGDEAYPPFSYLENGEAVGFDNDLMRAVAEVMGVKYSTDRDEVFDFSTPHSEIYFDLFIRKNSDIADIQDIEGKQILIQTGGIMEEYLKNIGFIVTAVYVETPLEALKILASGKYDGALLNKMQGYYFINENHLSNLKSVGDYIEQHPYGFVVANNETLLRELNQALAIVKTTGVYDQISKKWFYLYTHESFFDQARYYLYAGAGLLAFSLIVVSWLWTVRKTVKRRTNELKASEEKYRQLIQNAAEGVIVISDAKIVYINPIGCEILGIPEEEDYSQYRLEDIVHQDDLEPVRHKYAQSIKNGTNAVLVTVRILKKTEEICWMKASLIRMEWDQKPAVLCFFTDITEEKFAEDKIRTSEERYRLLFTKSPVGLFYYDNS
jgi:PAS domain S-box-containing protein